jgi:hypothetical protein
LRTQDNPEQIPRLSRQTAELLWKSTGRNLENLHSFALAERAFPEIIFCLAASHCLLILWLSAAPLPD